MKLKLVSALFIGSMASQLALAAVGVVFTPGFIANSKHDLSAGSAATIKSSGAITEICVFCHTPHAADIAKGPLWNRVSAIPGSPSATYSATATGTMDSEVLATFLSGSAACMTCHDGVGALDALINLPGSTNGSLNPANPGVQVGFLLNNTTNGTIVGARVVGGAATGTDLSDDHPIGVAYGGGGFGFAAATTLRDQDFILAPAAGNPIGIAVSLVKNGTAFAAATTIQPAPNAATDKYWINTDGAAAVGTKSKQDLPLYVRSGFTAATMGATSQPTVECATCHDVHNAGNGSFLRISNASSSLCYACHLK